MNKVDAQRHILLTGVTGAIGSAILGELLKETGTRIYVLVRPKSPKDVRQRVEKILQFLQVTDIESVWQDRLRVEAGDITQDSLGLPAATYQMWTKEMTHVIHAAGNVRLNQSLEDARKDAVISTQNILRFIHDCKPYHLVKLDHFSTVGVCGVWNAPVPEKPMPPNRTFRNTYEAAKAEAEDLVWDEMQKGVSGTIHRPSMVVGDSQSGRILYFQVFYYLIELITGARMAGWVAESGPVRLDIIPSDYVAQAVAISSRSPESIGRIFHLCSGETQAPTITKMGSELRDILARRGRKLPKLKTISPKWILWVSRGLAPLMPGKLGRMFKSIPFMLSYLSTAQTFVNEETDRFFSERGLKIPRLESYLEKIVDYYLAHKK